MGFHRSEQHRASLRRNDGPGVRTPGPLLFRRPVVAVFALLAAATLPSLGLSTAADAANTVPGAPSAVSATPLDSAATVNWTVGANGGAPIVNFLLTAFVGSTV